MQPRSRSRSSVHEHVPGRATNVSSLCQLVVRAGRLVVVTMPGRQRSPLEWARRILTTQAPARVGRRANRGPATASESCRFRPTAHLSSRRLGSCRSDRGIAHALHDACHLAFKHLNARPAVRSIAPERGTADSESRAIGVTRISTQGRSPDARLQRECRESRRRPDDQHWVTVRPARRCRFASELVARSIRRDRDHASPAVISRRVRGAPPSIRPRP